MSDTYAKPTQQRLPLARRRSAFALRAQLSGLLFILPAVLLVVAVMAVPLLQALYYSFTDWNGIAAHWVGLANFANIFTDAELKRSFINSFILLASVPVGMIFPFVTAYLLHRGVFGINLYRSLIFAPTALSWVVIGVIARQVFAGDGPLNGLLHNLNLDGLALNWLADPVWSMIAVVMTFNAAIFGVNATIFLTALSTVDKSTIEAARIDGASEARILASIIFPAVKRFIEFVFIITMVVSFTGLFGLIYVMTGGGPGAATMTLEFAVWRRALSTGAFGPGTAVGVSLMLLVLLIIAVIRTLSRDDRAA